MQRTNSLHIKTPEGITFQLFVAGPFGRFLAWSIDLACIAVIMTALNIGIRLVTIASRDIAYAVAIISYFFVSIGYGMFCEWYYRGQTVGKKLLSLRVMDVQGLHLQFSQIVIRNVLRFIDSLPATYLVGGLACLLSRRAQRLGDLAANTIIIREPKISQPDLKQLLAHKYNSLRNYPHLVGRLRQRVAPHEADVAVQALLRRDELDPEARVGLFAQLANHFKGIVSFPQEATDGITDEQFVRNCVDVLFRAT